MSRRSKTEVDRVADEIVERVGTTLVVATPLGVGKPIHLLNALYEKAQRDRHLRLEIITALTLAPPDLSNELARRLAGPIAARLSGHGPEPSWDVDRRAGKLPHNVRIREFYLPPGAVISVVEAQHEYISANYHLVGEVIAGLGVNVLAQLVSPIHDGTVSLGTNPDLTIPLLESMAARRIAGERNLTVGVTSPAMPYLFGDAVVEQARFDILIDVPDSPLFGMPNPAVDQRDAVVGALAAGLVKDSGTIQLGIGSLGDAIAAALRLRHRDPSAFGKLIEGIGRPSDVELIEWIGGRGPFDVGLYSSTEMMSDGLLALFQEGVIRRRVQDDARLQHVIDSEAPTGRPTLTLIAALADAGLVSDPLSADDVASLRSLGMVRRDVEYSDGRLVLDGQFLDPEVGAHLEAVLTERIGGIVMHVAFAIGSPAFYQALRDLDSDSRAAISMKDVGFTNSLIGQQELKFAQRRHARFVNITMQMTLLGEAASDTLSDGRVVSGVGGQHDFVTMAHDLPGARSVIMGRATRSGKKGEVSNVVWSHGHATIPRHLRDLVVTEYGIADLRGKTDSEVIAAMIEIADSRFQEGLMSEAKGYRKLPKSYALPDSARSNVPERYEGAFARAGVTVERFPFGTTISDVEGDLARAMAALQTTRPNPRTWPSWSAVRSAMGSLPPDARPHLERMGLAEPRGVKERLLAAAVVAGLAEVGIVAPKP